MQRKKIAIIGLGVMGSRHMRVVSGLTELFELVGGYDQDEQLKEEVCARYQAPALTSLEEAIELAEVVLISTPTSTHFELAKQTIEAGRDLFVEKPLADTHENCQKLIELQKKHGVRMGVGHVERFNPVIQWLRERLHQESLLSINIERVGPNPPQIKDVGIVTDLAVHDLDLIAFLSKAPLGRLSCVGSAEPSRHENVAQIITTTDNGVVGSINTNWLTPFKSRQITIATKEFFFQGDLLRGSGRVYSLLDTKASSYSVEEAIFFKKEPLVAQMEAFAGFLKGEETDTASAEDGTQIVAWAESCLVDMERPHQDDEATPNTLEFASSEPLRTAA